MTIAELDWVAVLLRSMIYIGTIASAGTVILRATLRLPIANATTNLQIAIGLAILFVCEPLRYIAFQLSIAQGDWQLAFDPTMRWMAVETPLGQAGSLRLLAGIGLLVSLFKGPLALLAAILMIGSYLLEGHTVSSDQRPFLAALLFGHLAVVHWWLAALIPLKAVLAISDHHAMAESIEDFGRKALMAVALLIITGGLLLGQLTLWQLNLAQPYQQGFAAKLIGVAAILGIAAINKLRWTPGLTSDPVRAQAGLRASINIELIIAGAILVLTAIATSFPPTPS